MSDMGEMDAATVTCFTELEITIATMSLIALIAPGTIGDEGLTVLSGTKDFDVALAFDQG